MRTPRPGDSRPLCEAAPSAGHSDPQTLPMRHRLSKDVQLLALRSRQLWSGMPSKGGVAPGVPKPEAAPSALGGSGTLPESRLSWADPRRPVSISQGALALILMGGVALGAQHDRLGVAQHGGAASTPSSTPGAASALSHQLAGAARVC